MTGQYVKDIVVEAVRVTIVAAVTFWVTPHLQGLLPGIPDLILFALTAFITSVLMLMLWMWATATATVRVVWHEQEHDIVELDQLVLRLDGVPGSATYGDAGTRYWLSIIHQEGTGLGGRLLRRAARRGLRVRVQVVHSDLTMMPALIPGDSTLETVIPGNQASIDMLLPGPLPEPGQSWKRTLVEFTGRVKGPAAQWRLDSDLIVDTRHQWVYGRLLIADAKVVSVHETWS